MQLLVAGSYEADDYRSRIVNTFTGGQEKEIPSANIFTSTNTPEYSNTSSEKRSLDKEELAAESIAAEKNTNTSTSHNTLTHLQSDEIPEPVRKRIKNLEKCDEVVKENLIEIWRFLLDMKSEIATKNANRVSAEEEVSITVFHDTLLN